MQRFVRSQVQDDSQPCELIICSVRVSIAQAWASCGPCFAGGIDIWPRPQCCTGQTGSFLNMAPEVVLKQPYNEKADIFSLGCCMFEVRVVSQRPNILSNKSSKTMSVFI